MRDIISACFCRISQNKQVYSATTEYQRTSLTILPTENYNLPFKGHKIPYLSSLLVTCHQSSRLNSVNTLQHIFETCTVHNAERTALLLELQNITPNIILNSNLFQTGNNDKTLDLCTQNQICTAIFKYTITIWKQCIKLKPP